MATQSLSESSPQPAYLASRNSPIHANEDLIKQIAKSKSRSLIHEFVLPPRSGQAWKVAAGNIVRISTPDGPQVGDLNIFNQHNPRERFWAARTRQIHSSHVTVGDRLWSCLPYLRPMVTIVADSIGERYNREKGGQTEERKGHRDEWGGRCHDLLGTRCDPYIGRLLNTAVEADGEVISEGEDYDFHCHSNLTRAILPFGLHESDVHDVLNVFQVTLLDQQGRYCMRTCPAKSGDYFEFFAESDLLCALSTCPGGDLSSWGWSDNEYEDKSSTTPGTGKKEAMLKCCRPLKVEVFAISDDKILQSWKPSSPSKYSGMHGIKIPLGEPHE